MFNALHGQIGEDGNVQGLLNIMNIPYTHSGLLASAIAMDKIMAKRLLAMAGIMVPQDILLVEDSRVYPQDKSKAHVIKPRNDGSSVGVVIVKEGDEAPQRSRWDLETQLICEPFIPGRELTVRFLTALHSVSPKSSRKMNSMILMPNMQQVARSTFCQPTFPNQ